MTSLVVAKELIDPNHGDFQTAKAEILRRQHTVFQLNGLDTLLGLLFAWRLHEDRIQYSQQDDVIKHLLRALSALTYRNLEVSRRLLRVAPLFWGLWSGRLSKECVILFRNIVTSNPLVASSGMLLTVTEKLFEVSQVSPLGFVSPANQRPPLWQCGKSNISCTVLLPVTLNSGVLAPGRMLS